MRCRSLALFCPILVLAVGCHNNYQMLPPKPSPPVVANPHLKIALQITPRPVRQMDPTKFTIKLTDALGKPVGGAQVGANLVMPAMDMGENKIALAAQGPGEYSGTGRFSMEGDWNVTVTAAKGRERAVRTFPISVQ